MAVEKELGSIHDRGLCGVGPDSLRSCREGIGGAWTGTECGVRGIERMGACVGVKGCAGGEGRSASGTSYTSCWSSSSLGW